MSLQEKTLGNDRATGIIIHDGKLLLIHRIKEDNEYWVLPGGTQEFPETIEQTLDREMLEEVGIQVLDKKPVFSIQTSGRTDHHFLITRYNGDPKMGGPELERMNERNVYMLERVDVHDLDNLNILPPEAALKLKEFLRNK